LHTEQLLTHADVLTQNNNALQNIVMSQEDGQTGGDRCEHCVSPKSRSEGGRPLRCRSGLGLHSLRLLKRQATETSILTLPWYHSNNTLKQRSRYPQRLL